MARESTVAEVVASIISQFNATICFGVVGTANFVVTKALAENGVRFVAARHESNAVMMADGVSRTTGQLALASVHSGPGLTNAVTAIAEAAKNRTALLVLTGDVATGDLRNNFSFDQASLVKSVGANFEKIHTGKTAVADTIRAVTRVVRDRQTVVLSLPEDVQAELVHLPDAGFQTYDAWSYRRRTTAPDTDSVGSLADAVQRAKHPLILAGRGAVVANARDSLLFLGNQIGALIATSLAANGLFEGADWNLGIVGGFSSPVALDAVPDCDLILGFGVSFSHWTTRQGRLINPNATIVQIDNDLERLGVNRATGMQVLGDAALTAEALSAELNRRGLATQLGWRTTGNLSSRFSSTASNNDVESYIDGPDLIDPRLLSKTVDSVLPKDRIVVTDSGHFMGWPPQYISVPDAQGWCMPTSFQSIGLALGASIGAGIVQPARVTILAIGDGGLMMSISDLITAVTLNLRMCIVVYNDSAYSAEVHYFQHRGYDTSIVEFPNTSFLEIAKALGAEAIVVKSTKDLESLHDWVDRGCPGTFLIDARVDPSVVADWYRDAFLGDTSVH